MRKAIETLKNIWKIEDLRQRILITILFVAIYRFGSYVVLPGINPAMLAKLHEQTSEGLLALLNMFSGGAFSNASIFALGIMPYISASIVIQLLGIAVPYFQKLQREGESGRRKMNQYTRYLTIAILLVQAPSYLLNLKMQAGPSLNASLDWTLFMVTSTIILAAGSMFILWLGERITDKGIGNGISFIILIGIIARFPDALLQEVVSRVANKSGGLIMFIIEIVFLLLVIGAAILLVQGTRKIPVQYAKKVQGRKQMGGQSSNIPLKVNTAGVIPVIFASSLMAIPSIITSLFGKSPSGVGAKILQGMSQSYWFNPNYPWGFLGLAVYILLVFFFAYFYTAITFNPMEIANNMKKSGGFVPGIRPGKPTQDYLNKILNYIIFIGAVGLLIVAMIPMFFNGFFSVNVSFGGTSIIIVVGVVIETMKSLESQMLVRHYQGFLLD